MRVRVEQGKHLLFRNPSPHDKLLLGSLECSHGRSAIERLRYPLPYVDQSDQKAERDQHTVGTAREVNPVIADITRVLPAQTTYEAADCCKACCGTHHHQESDGGHLREIRETCLAGIGLPISICYERSGGVESQVGCLRASAQRVERQQVLYPQKWMCSYADAHIY